VGYQRQGEDFTEILEVCEEDSQTIGNALPFDGSCKISVDSDLIVWTKHFTVFGVFTSTPIIQGGGVVMLFNQNPPTPPQGGYVLKINNGDSNTLSSNVILTINGGKEAKAMAIGNDNVFTFQEPYITTKQWTLIEGQGLKQVCIKFYNEHGYSSQSVCDSIYLGEPPETSSLNELITNTKYKETSNNVKQLQINLKSLGFFPNDIDCTGYYGSITKKAVTKYQISQQLISKPANEFTREELINILKQLISILD
ncbi:MAG: peptidoglycan-binding domain-containing protein, partial [Candidatus Pacebacteria bacterium]|nr:peptidoglycan-binding domain-containing protein [Candidatus Paceibacterota bacterium]